MTLFPNRPSNKGTPESRELKVSCVSASEELCELGNAEQIAEIRFSLAKTKWAARHGPPDS